MKLMIDQLIEGIRDIRGSLLRLKVGSTVGMAELLNIAATLDVALRAKSYGRREADDEDQDSLEGLFAQIEPLSNLNHEIRRCIIDEETMADDASPTLKSIRRFRNRVCRCLYVAFLLLYHRGERAEYNFDRLHFSRRIVVLNQFFQLVHVVR